MNLNRFIQGGWLTDLHKNKINTRELLTKLNKTAKEKINEQRTNNKRLRQSN